MNQTSRGVFDPMQYPPPPPPLLTPTKKGDCLPDAPGIYFVWEGAAIVYVGQSKRLRGRVTLRHPNIRAGDVISYMEFPDQNLDRIEAFYIGIIYPKRNSMMPKVPWWRMGV